MSRDHYMAAHEELIDEYLEENPDADWSEAYEKTADAAHTRSQENFWDRVDYYHQLRKEEGSRS